MADEEERRPLRHLKFREFENVSGDLSADEIRRLYANKMTELRDNARGNSQALENLKKDKEEEKKELDEQKTDLGKDPRTFYIKMKERYDSEMSALAAEYPDQSDPEYSRRADLIKARFAHVLDKELLDSNQNAYVNKVMDAVERSEAKISNDLRVAETKTNAENNKLAASVKMLNDQQKLLEANPDLYARLYNIKQRSATHDDPRKDPQTMIAADKKGQPCLAVIMADARFPAGFIVSDGKINFSQDNIDKMTVEMMRQIIDYLDRRGIHGIELPDGIDEKLAAAYNEADGANREAEDAARINEQETPEAEEAPIRPLPENDGREEIPASGYTNQDARDFADEFGGNETVMAAQTVDYGKLVSNIDDWVFGVGGMNKQKNWTGFKKYKGSRTGDFLRTIAGKGMSGWDCWAVYDQGNFKNDELDGKVDKDGYMKVKYAFKIYSRVKKDDKGNDRLEIRYAMPGGKKITDGYAKGVMRMLKKCGMTHVNFPDGLPEEDEGTFRIAAASNGLVPLFKNLSESKVKKMLEEAESKLSGAEFLTYKKKLADWMQECAMEDCAKDGKDFSEHKNATVINNLLGEYEYQPFRDMYEKGGGIRGALEEIIKKNENNKGNLKDEHGNPIPSGAVKIAAAADAVSDAFNLYRNFNEKSIATMLSGIVDYKLEMEPNNALKTAKKPQLEKDAAEIQKLFAQNLAKKGIKLDMNKKVRDMKPSEMNAFYKALLPSKEREFANEFDNELIANSKKDREESESKILSKVVGKASKHFSTVSKLLEDNGVKKIYLPDLGSYDHNFSSNKERLIAEGRMKGKKPRRGPDHDFDYDDDDYGYE